MQLSESKTLENLKTTFANESAAMVRYEIFAEKAKQNGDEEISQIFRTTAKNEKATHKYGSDLSTEEYRKPPMRLKRQCTAKTTSGRRCIRSMPKPQDRKGLTI